MRAGSQQRPMERRDLLFVREARGIGSTVGRVQDLVGCPFCDGETYTYRWSRWGSGKRCDHCSAVLRGWYAYRYTDKVRS